MSHTKVRVSCVTAWKRSPAINTATAAIIRASGCRGSPGGGDIRGSVYPVGQRSTHELASRA
jgi:hypothetical protein